MLTAVDEALCADHLFRNLDPAGHNAMVVAVSGGSDSKALLLLLHDHLRSLACLGKLLAVTVDHGLRAEAADEAREVAAVCSALKVRHRTMAWQGTKPATGLAAAARAARYRLLLQAAEEAGADLLFTGHTADDQAETIAMRAKRGTGIGLAGMAPATLLNGRAWLLRPLLNTTRAELRAFLSARGEDWIEDPGNANPASERVRVRWSLDDEVRRTWIARGEKAAADRSELAGRAADLIEAMVRFQDEGLVIAPALLCHPDQQAGIHVLRFLLWVLGGKLHLPDEQRTAALFPMLIEGGSSASLAGCVLAHRRDGIRVRREQRGGIAQTASAVTLLRGALAMRPIIPGFDLAVFQALTALAGAPALPALPFCDQDAPIP